jgi:hypothetical protein
MCIINGPHGFFRGCVIVMESLLAYLHNYLSLALCMNSGLEMKDASKAAAGPKAGIRGSPLGSKFWMGDMRDTLGTVKG